MSINAVHVSPRVIAIEVLMDFNYQLVRRLVGVFYVDQTFRPIYRPLGRMSIL